MADLGAYDEPVGFSDADAQALITACNHAATVIDGQAGSRRTSRTTGEDQFQGYFSTLFRDNGVTQVKDAGELASALRTVATLTGELQKAADAERARRAKAKEWKEQQKHKSFLDGLVDDGKKLLGMSDTPPVGPPAPPLKQVASKPAAGKRQSPPPGAGGGAASGTSSAIPDNLRTFAANTVKDDTALSTQQTKVTTAYDAFTASCRWGHLDASGVLTGFAEFLAGNAEEVAWANTVAAAFEKAGGSGTMCTLSNAVIAAALASAHVSATRQDLTIDMPTVKGGLVTSGYADDPVNTATGNFIEPEVDLTFEGGCGTLLFSRMYNSVDPTPGGFGPGWSSWSETRLMLADEEARWVLADGRNIVFPRTADGWDRSAGSSHWFAAEGDALVVSDNSGGRWRFTEAGRLESFGRGAGTRVDVMYGPDGRLAGLVHERGRSIAVDWDGDRIARVGASDGRWVAYSYDERGRLTAASGPTGERRYVWGVDSGLLEQVIDGDGVVALVNGYDERGRVVWQRSPFGRVSRYTYLPGGVTEVADANGERANIWMADGLCRLVGVVDSDGNRQSYEWDAYGNMVRATDRVGQRTSREYDDRGRLIRQVTSTGADLQYGYDDRDRVTTVVVGTADDEGPYTVTTYEYEGDERHPSVIVDPAGGRTAMVWEQSLLLQVTDPTGVALRFGYDEHGDLISTTNAVGGTARLERDAAGRVTAAVTPSGHRTTYTYDEAGHLVARRDPDGAVWRFEHTAAGRLSAQIAPDGARTQIEYGPTGEETRTIDPLGRTVTRVLDDLGNLASVRLPDGSTWSYTHDALSRLVQTVDPAGGVWEERYDANGDPIATVDPMGVTGTVTVNRADHAVVVDDGLLSSTMRLDALGRPRTVDSGDGDERTYVYDACGRVVEILDREGALTLIRRDAGGRPVQVTDPTGLTTGYVYDACGRLSRVIGPDGAVTTREYDTDSLLVRQTLPNGDVARAAYDPCGRLLRVHQPGSGTAAYAYDRCGRVISAVDTWWGTRRFAYDGAGQLIAVTNGLGGVTRYDYDENGRLIRITDPAGGVTLRTWDAANRLVSETDPLGRTTTAGYDAAGRQTWQRSPDGHRLSFSYDASGRSTSTAVDGTVISSITRDLPRRTITIDDRTGARPITHVQAWDRAGRLIRHTRTISDGITGGLAWRYDRAGRRTAMVDAFGRVTEYRRDHTGRLSEVEHPDLGTVTFAYDPAGQLVEATTVDPAGNATRQAWEWADGSIVAHSVTGSEGTASTVIERDADGRITGIARDGVITDYAYDLAGQLTEAVTDGARQGWAFDVDGRLVRHTSGEVSEGYSYDSAGQLVAVHHGDGTTTLHEYDPEGRRTRTIRPDGTIRDYSWTPTGWLRRLVDTGPDGSTGTTILYTDATGQLAQAGANILWWDSAAAVPALAGIGRTPILPLGAVTGVADRWTTPGWRAGRADADDPWRVDPVIALPDGLWLTATGTVTMGAAHGFGPLEWLGARAYDPASRGFLATDPLPPVTGAGWAANPYSYAGNNPLAFTDPTGLRPLTDAQLKAQTEGWASKAWSATTTWVGENWEYLAGGAMVVAGGVMMATGVGGPVGAMLISAGADTIIQKATTGNVNWGEVALSGALGGVGDFGVAARLGLAGVKATVVSGSVAGAAGGGITNTYDYFSGPGPHTVTGALESAGAGTISGGVLGAAGGAAGHAIGDRLMGTMTHNPQAEIMAMGRNMPQRVVPYAEGHGYGYYTGTPDFIHSHLPVESRLQSSVDLWFNKKWINYQMMEGNALRDVGELPGMRPSPFYDMERQQVHGWNNGAGYGDYQLDIQP